MIGNFLDKMYDCILKISNPHIYQIMLKTPNDYSENLVKIIELFNRASQMMSQHASGSKASLHYKKTMNIYNEIYAKLAQNPDKLFNKQLQLYSEYLKIGGNVWDRYLDSGSDPLYKTDPKDRRFKDDSWNRDFMFDFIKQSYVATNNWFEDLVDDLQDVDVKTLQKFKFYIKLFNDSLSPSNFSYSNPEVIRETINSNGENLVKGLENFIADIEKSKDLLQISTIDKSNFKIGENIAATKGKVIYKNDIMELIRYDAVANKVHEAPLLIIPAWINKYYILDLSEQNSFVKWATGQGYDVYMISWVNPDAKHANKKFEDYVQEGAIDAIEQVIKISGKSQISVMGYCLGGTMLSCALAYLKSQDKNYVKNVTLITTMIDFDNIGDMSVFIDEEQIQDIENIMQETGYLDGSEMAAIFNMMRSNDLIWSFVVNNYLLGKSPLAFDILYWNADVTRMPAKNHSFYLRNMYLQNKLKDKGGIEIFGEKIDVSQIDIPTYMLATKEDHIAPWQTCFKTTNIFQGENRFVLAGSGHVAGVVNPPYKQKYGYHVSNSKTTNADDWLENAEHKSGSWWNDWNEWSKKFSDKMIKPNDFSAEALYDAPGEYVKG